MLECPQARERSSVIKQELITFGTALMFLTRLPVGSWCSGEARVLSNATRYFPAVGFIVGSLLGLFLWMCTVVLPASLCVGLTVVAGVLITGAFHEDGLADVADSAGAFGVDRKLDIMRDSRVGTYGSLALILLILIKYLALWELIDASLPVTLAALVCAHVLSRWSSVWLMATQAYARPEAANRVVAEGVDARRFMLSTLCAVIALLPAAVWVSPMFYLLFFIAWLISACSAYRFRKAFGGITGDCLGATNQLVEVGVYLVVVAVVV